MKTTTIDVKCGIYDTCYTIRDYGSKMTIKAPYIKWTNNSGNLNFANRTITTPRGMAYLREMTASGELVTDDTTTIDEVLS